MRERQAKKEGNKRDREGSPTKASPVAQKPKVAARPSRARKIRQPAL